MDKTRILFMSHSSGLNGAEICLLTLLKYVNRNTYDPIVILPDDGPLANEMEALGIKTYVRPLERWIHFQYDRPLAGTTIQSRVAEISEIIEKESVGIVQTNSTIIVEGALAARALSIPHIWHVHEMLIGHPELTPIIPLPLVFKLISDLSVHVVTEADTVQKQFSGLIAPEKLLTIYTGIEMPPSTDGRSSMRKELGIHDDETVALTVGSLSKRKGYPNLIEAASLTKKAGCSIKHVWVGSGSREAICDYQCRISQHNLQGDFIYTGFRKDIPAMMQCADLFILPSENEAFPVVVLEAMASGIPVITTQCGGVVESVVEGETGYIVPVNDPQELSTRIIQLVANNGGLRKMGHEGLKRFDKYFKAEVYASRFETTYSNILKQSKAQMELHDHDRVILNGLQDVYQIISENRKPNSFAELYVDTGNGFNEENALRCPLSDQLNSKTVIVEFELGNFREIRALRFDPIADSPAVIDLVSAVTQSSNTGSFELLINGSNAAITSDNRYFFTTRDPSMFFSLPEGMHDAQKIQITLKYAMGEEHESLIEGIVDELKGPPLIAKLYVDTGEGFTEESSLTQVLPQAPGSVSAKLRFALGSFDHIKAFRLDPIEKAVSIIDVCRVELHAGNKILELPVTDTNAACVKDKRYVFTVEDPILYLDMPEGVEQANVFYIELKYILKDEYVNTIGDTILDHLISEFKNEISGESYVAKVYIDTGFGFSEDNSITLDLPADLGTNDILLDFDLAQYKQINQLRFDPVENAIPIVDIINIDGYIDNRSFPISISETNSKYFAENTFIFTTNDPIINIALPNNITFVDRLHIEYRMMVRKVT
jgi:glycosyltransferase involved in cell wall biosynthesis